MDLIDFIVYDVASYEIVSTGQCTADVFEMQALNPGQAVIEGVANSSSAYVVNGEIVLYTPEQQAAKSNFPGFEFVWSNTTFSWYDPRDAQQKYDSCAEGVISMRNSYLYESDWTQIPNNPLTLEVQQEWAVYRQELRDVTQQSGFPFNVVWPTPPASS